MNKLTTYTAGLIMFLMIQACASNRVEIECPKFGSVETERITDLVNADYTVHLKEGEPTTIHCDVE